MPPGPRTTFAAVLLEHGLLTGGAGTVSVDVTITMLNGVTVLGLIVNGHGLNAHVEKEVSGP